MQYLQKLNQESVIMLGMKILLFTLLTLNLLFSATAEQIEQYISVSNTEEQLIQLESSFSVMQNGFSEDANGSKSNYDMELLTIRFKEYLQTHLSEHEMAEILDTYRNVVFLQFKSYTTTSSTAEEQANYLQSLSNEEEDEASTRLGILDDIAKYLKEKEQLGAMFDALIKPLLQTGKNTGDMNEQKIKKRRESYVKSMMKGRKEQLFFSLKEFTLEDLETVLDIIKSTEIQREMKIQQEATFYALKEFFLSMASRYDVSKH